MKLQKIALSVMAMGFVPCAFAYQISITEPAESRAYQRPAQSIEIATEVTPTLSDGESVRIVIGGVDMGVGQSASLPTIELNPGEHVVRATVVDKYGNLVASTERTIYLIQNTPLQRARREQQRQYEAYQALPLHRKILLNLRPSFEPPKPVDGVPPAP